ncbi:uracil-DNA glycosylase [uncultured Limosilactobacillus sp.]|uniref:uracil-DNA glycosylase n=1 Tax=uncultured Limosilactobacillus sp. TaxID=2837629 RepID=UPI0025DD3FE1|nr:uracil-DNA glycosylase [uncultured Limosilactobacillus sp.]
MKIKYPPELVAQVKERTVGRQLTGFVAGMGPEHPQIVLLGEAPGRKEAETGVPFVGSSGQELMKMIALADLTRDDVYITSVVRSRPYSIRHVQDKKTGVLVEKHPNRTPTKKEVLAYAQLFDWELQTVHPQIIVPLGNTSLQRLLGSQANVGQLHGQPMKTTIQQSLPDNSGYEMGTAEYWVYPMYHPAAYLYARRLEPTVRTDWQRFGQWLKKINNSV